MKFVLLLLFLFLNQAFSDSSISQSLCETKILPDLENPNPFEIGKTLDIKQYIDLCKQIFGCLWGVKDFLNLGEMEISFLSYLLFNVVGNRNEEGGMQSYYEKDWGSERNIFKEMLEIIPTIPAEVDRLQKFLDSKDIFNDSPQFANKTKNLMNQMVVADRVKYEKFLFRFFEVLWTEKYNETLSKWQKNILWILIHFHAEDSNQKTITTYELRFEKIDWFVRDMDQRLTKFKKIIWVFEKKIKRMSQIGKTKTEL